MQNYSIKSVMALVCLTACLILVLVPVPVKAQGSDLGLSIALSPSTVNRGGTVGVFALVTNNTSSKMRTTVTLASLSACGTQTNLGYNRLALYPGQSIQVTASYPISPDACPGVYAVSRQALGRTQWEAALPLTLQCGRHRRRLFGWRNCNLPGPAMAGCPTCLGRAVRSTE